MSPTTKLKALITGDMVLTSIIGILFLYFTFTASRWIDKVDELSRYTEANASEIRTIKATNDARWDEVIRRLATIDQNIQELRRK